MVHRRVQQHSLADRFKIAVTFETTVFVSWWSEFWLMGPKTQLFWKYLVWGNALLRCKNNGSFKAASFTQYSQIYRKDQKTVPYWVKMGTPKW